jgi:chromosome segregation ATPase
MASKTTNKPITFDEVAVACEEIVKSGEHPSIIRVHQFVGRGSYSTIKKHIDQWTHSEEGKDVQSAQLPAVVELPASFTQEAEHFLKKIYQLAESESAAKVDQIRAERDQAVAEAEEQSRQAIDYADEISSEKTELEAALEDEKRRVADHEEEIGGLKSKIYRLEEDKAESSRYLAEADEQITALSKVVTDLEQKAALLEQERDLSVQSLAEVKSELSDVRKGHETAIRELKDDHKADQKQLRGEHKTSTEELKASYESAAKTMANSLRDAKKQRDDLSAKVDSLTSKLDESKSENAEQRKRIEELENQLKEVVSTKAKD